MAEGKEVKKEDTSEVSGEKKGSKLKLILLLFIILLLAGGGVFVWYGFFRANESDVPAEDSVEKVEKKESSVISNLTLAPFLVNLANKGGTKYLKVSITLGLTNDEVEKNRDKYTPSIRNAILFILTNKSLEEIYSTTGKRKLQEEIIERLSDVVGPSHIKEVYFTEFIVQ
ncbi:MAG: flagellar basal body-associated FliL family protein [Thermodesulfobacteriota bacterium]|nr:flagellar basal body-associated FliL family protein [Thermodesulfobacteriota bacterium]